MKFNHDYDDELVLAAEAAATAAIIAACWAIIILVTLLTVLARHTWLSMEYSEAVSMEAYIRRIFDPNMKLPKPLSPFR